MATPINNPALLLDLVHQMQVWRLKVLLHEEFGTSPMPSSLLQEHWLGQGRVQSLVPPQELQYYRDQVPWSADLSAVSPAVSLEVLEVKLSNMPVKTYSE